MMCNQGQINRTVGFSRFPQPKKSAIQTTMTCSYSTYNYLLPIYSSISCNFYCVLHSIWMSPFYCIFHKFLLSFQTILVPSDFDNGIWISTSTFLIASLVNLSDHSLPTIPIWARVHIINIFFSHNLWWAKITSYRICWWLLVFPFSMLNNADDESLHIIIFEILLSSTHSKAK